jgi:hypothetical protein
VYLGTQTGKGPHGLTHAVVSKLVSGLEHRGHVVVTDNFFSGVRLFHDLLYRGFLPLVLSYENRKGLSIGLGRPKKKTAKCSVVIRMHNHRQMTALSWQDNELVTLLSTSSGAWNPGMTVLRR